MYICAVAFNIFILKNPSVLAIKHTSNAMRQLQRQSTFILLPRATRILQQPQLTHDSRKIAHQACTALLCRPLFLLLAKNFSSTASSSQM